MLKVFTLNISHGAPSLPVPFPFLLPRHRLLGLLDRMAGLLARENVDVVEPQEADRAGLFSGPVALAMVEPCSSGRCRPVRD